MSTAKTAFFNVNDPFWNQLAHPVNFQEFHAKVTDLRHVFWERGPAAPSNQILSRVAQVFTNATDSLQFQRHLNPEENGIYKDLNIKLFEWTNDKNELQIGAARNAIENFRCRCAPPPKSRDPFKDREEAREAAAALLRAKPPAGPAYAPIFKDGVLIYTKAPLEQCAADINAADTSRFEFVNCSYQAGGASHLELDAQINWGKFTHLTIRGFKGTVLDLSSAMNLQELVIEDSPALQALIEGALPQLRRLVLKDNASFQPTLAFLYKMPQPQLLNLEVVISNCPKINKEILQTAIRAGLTNVEYTTAPSPVAPPQRLGLFTRLMMGLTGLMALFSLAYFGKFLRRRA